jgi:hypothetical protein
MATMQKAQVRGIGGHDIMKGQAALMAEPFDVAA